MAGRDEHLSKEQAAAFAAGALAGRELLLAGEHIETCDECLALIREVKPKTAIELTGVAEADHLSFDELAGFVDGKLGEVDAGIVEVHIADCLQCRTDVDQLRQLRDEITSAEAREPGSAETGDRRGLWSLWKIFVPVFAALVIAAIVWVSFYSRDAETLAEAVPEVNTANVIANTSPVDPESPTPDPAPEGGTVVASLSDGGAEIALMFDGNLAGLENAPPALREKVKAAFAGRQLSIPANDLGGSNGTLMGESEGVPFGLTGPVGKVVFEQRPTFRWQKLEGSENYVVRVYDDDFREVQASPKLNSTQWTPANPLPRGKTYRWQVAATKEGKEVRSPERPAPDARFRIVDAAAAEEINAVRRRYPNSSLLLGIVYAEAGLRPESEREFAKLARENPRSEIAKKLRAQVRSRR